MKFLGLSKEEKAAIWRGGQGVARLS